MIRAAALSPIFFVLICTASWADDIDCEKIISSNIVFRAISSSQSKVDSFVDVIRKEGDKVITVTRSPISGVAVRRYTGPVLNSFERPRELSRTVVYAPDLSESKIRTASNTVITVTSEDKYIAGSKNIFGDPNKDKSSFEKIRYDFIGNERYNVKNCSFEAMHWKETHISARDTNYSTIWQEFWYCPELKLIVKNVELIWDIGTKQKYTSQVNDIIVKK